MAIPENDYIGRLGSVIEQRGFPSEGKTALIAETDRQPAGKRPTAAEAVSRTQEIMDKIKPMIDEQSLNMMFKNPENKSRAKEILQRAAEGKIDIPKQYQEASKYLSKFGKDIRARKDIAQLSYDEQIEEAVKMLREEEKDEPLSWGQIAGRVAMATTPLLIGALVNPGVGAGAAQGILYGMTEAEKEAEKKKERERKITELGITSKLKKAAGEVEGLSDIEREIEKAKAKVPISYAEAAAELQRLGAKGIQNLSKDQLGSYLELFSKVLLESMKGDKEKTTKEPSQSQFKAARYAMDLEQAEENLLKLFSKGYDPGSLVTYLKETFTPGSLQSEEKRLYEQAISQFFNAVARPETGAVIGLDEKIEYVGRFFPKGGDSEAVKEQKARSRAQIIASTKAEAGRAYDMITKIQSSQQMIPKSPGPDFKRVKQNDKEFWFNPKTKESILIK